MNIPRAYPSEIRRTHLLQKLRSMQDTAVLLLMAPSGYGKTTLLAQFARSARRKGIWLTLQPQHANPLLLAKDLMELLQQSFPEHDWLWPDVSHVLPEQASQMVGHGLHNFRQNLYIVLDRTEMLSDSSGQWLEKMQSLLPEGMQLLLSGYSSSPLPFTKWLAQGIAKAVTQQDLMFSTQEMLECTGWQEDHANLSFLQEQLEGWPAGVALVAHGAPLGLHGLELLENQLAQLPEGTRVALQQLCAMDLWNEKIARELNVELPTGWSKQLLDLGLPLAPQQGGSHRPHALLRQALQEQLRAFPEQYKAVFERSAAHCLKHGQEIQALHCLIEAQNNPEASKLACKLIPAAINQGNREWILQIVDQLSLLPGALDEELVLQKTVALLDLGRLKDVDAWLEKHPLQERTAFYYSTMAYVQHRKGNFHLELELALEGKKHDGANKHMLGLLTYEAFALGGLGRYEEKLQVLQALLKQCIEERHLIGEAKAYVLLGDTHADLGQASKSEQSYVRALYLYQQAGVTARLNELYYNLAYSYLEWGNNIKALDTIEQAMQQKHGNYSSWEPLFVALRSNIQILGRQKTTEALSALETVIPQLEQKGWYSQAIAYSLNASDGWLYLQNPVQADMWLLHATNKTQASHRPEDALRFHEALKNLYLNEPLPDPEELSAINPAHLELYSAHRLNLLVLEAHRQRGSLREHHVTACLKTLEDLGHFHPLTVDARALQTLYLHCIQMGWGVESFKNALNLMAAPKPLDRRRLLEVQTLESFEVKLDGKPVALPLSKSQELLLFLAHHGPSTRDTIVQELWGEAARKENIDYFKLVVRKLRMALQEAVPLDFDPLPYSNKQYQLSAELNLKWDAQHLQNLQLQESVEEGLRQMLHYTAPQPQLNSEWWVLMQIGLHRKMQEHLLHYATTLHHSHEVVSLWEQVAHRLKPLDPEVLWQLEPVLLKLGHGRLFEQVKWQVQQSLMDTPYN